MGSRLGPLKEPVFARAELGSLLYDHAVQWP